MRIMVCAFRFRYVCIVMVHEGFPDGASSQWAIGRLKLEEETVMKRNGCRILKLLAVASAVAFAATTSAVAQSSEGLRIGVLGGVNWNYVDAPIQNFVHVPGNGNFASHDFSGASLIDGYAGLSGEYQFDDIVG